MDVMAAKDPTTGEPLHTETHTHTLAHARTHTHAVTHARTHTRRHTHARTQAQTGSHTRTHARTQTRLGDIGYLHGTHGVLTGYSRVLLGEYSLRLGDFGYTKIFSEHAAREPSTAPTPDPQVDM